MKKASCELVQWLFNIENMEMYVSFMFNIQIDLLFCMFRESVSQSHLELFAALYANITMDWEDILKE